MTIPKEQNQGKDEGPEAGSEAPSQAAEEKKEEEVVVSYESLKVDSALYRRDLEAKTAPNEPTLSTFFTGVTSISNKAYMLEFDPLVAKSNSSPESGADVSEGESKGGEKSAPSSPSKKAKQEDIEEPADPTKEYKLGVYSHEGKHMLKNPKATSIGYSTNSSFLIVGTSDGTVVLRPAKYVETFLRISAHNGRVTYADTSYDDKFIVSCGVDGVIAVHTIEQGADRQTGRTTMDGH